MASVTLPSWASSVVFSSATVEERTDSVNVLQRKLKEVTHLWWQLGLQLKEYPAPLDLIKSNNPGGSSPQDKFGQMLQYWIVSGRPKYRTWGALANAVDQLSKALGRQVRGLKHYDEGSIADVKLLELTTLLQEVVPQWRTLALNLGIPLWYTDMIDNKLKAEDCFFRVLDQWFTNSNKDEEPTLEVLYHALESHAVGNRALALKILEDVEVLELLTVSDKAKEKKKVEKELKDYIAKFKKEEKFLTEKESNDKQQEDPSKKPQEEEAKTGKAERDPVKEKKWVEKLQQDLDKKNAESTKKEESKESSPELATAVTGTNSSTTS